MQQSHRSTIRQETLYELCRQREVDCSYGSRQHVFSRKACSKLYGHLHRSNVLPQRSSQDPLPLGSVFNLEFSPEEDFAVAVLAGRAFEVYDPRVHKKIHCQHGAHDDCVNCVTFINSRQFATCSDDTTIRLWDLKNLRFPLGVLHGHRNWVKNIEYDRSSGRLFSIAFQDGVRYWDIENLAAYSNDDDRENLVATLDDPLRMRLAPDGSKMFITSLRSQCLVINDFDGKKLTERSVQELHNNFLQNQPSLSLSQTLKEKLRQLPSNRPSLYFLCANQGMQKYRMVMSAAFHPSSDFVGMRHTDFGDSHINQELTSLLDLRQDSYCLLVGIKQVQHKYLRYVDDISPIDSRDYIKEICFSRDGRVLASPYENGVRLLAIDPQCTSPDLYFDSRYHSQHKEDNCPDFEEVLCTPATHLSPVLTCKFARHDFILATGSLDGTVAFSSPQI